MSRLHPGEEGYEGSAYEKYNKQQVDKINGQGGHYEDSPYIPGPNACLRSKFIGGGKWVADPIPNAPVQLPSVTEPEAAVIPEIPSIGVSMALNSESNRTSPTPNQDDNGLLLGRLNVNDAFGTKVGPCLFRACLGVGETLAGRNLKADEINEAKKYFGKKFIDVWNYGNKTKKPILDTSDQYYMYGGPSSYAAVINWVLDHFKTGRSVKVFNNGQDACASILRGYESGPYYWGIHFVEGDAWGRFRWNPSGGVTDPLDPKKLITPTYFGFVE
jgi:hypothetical protein